MRRPNYLFPAGARFSEDNVVLHASARRHQVSNYAGPLSIKTVIRGRVSWVVGGRDLVVDRSSFLVLGAGEPYSMNIDAVAPVETCCAFFADNFVERVALDLTSPVDTALDAPDRLPPALPYLSAVHDLHETSIQQRLWTLAQRCEQALAPSAVEQDFLLLGQSLLGCYRRIRE